MNQEFRKFFQNLEYVPILRKVEINRYWIDKNFLEVEVGSNSMNIANPVIRIIVAYIDAKRKDFEEFIQTCLKMQSIQGKDAEHVQKFLLSLLQSNVDASVFEIVSYAVLKEDYADQVIYWGWSMDGITEDRLTLYKTGRINANDGGIDFVKRPLERYFQVTETVDVRKCFLDIDKVQRYPITFVIKSTDDAKAIFKTIRSQAEKSYGVAAIVQRYMD